MKIPPITTEEEYQQALQEIEPYFDDEPDLETPEGDHFKALVEVIEAYEKIHYPIAPPDKPINWETGEET